MASGWGAQGKVRMYMQMATRSQTFLIQVGRCYPIWMDFSDCMSKCQDPIQCAEKREDYFECLHHRKEVRIQCRVSGFTRMWLQFARMNAIALELQRQKDGGPLPKHH